MRSEFTEIPHCRLWLFSCSQRSSSERRTRRGPNRPICPITRWSRRSPTIWAHRALRASALSRGLLGAHPRRRLASRTRPNLPRSHTRFINGQALKMRQPRQRRGPKRLTNAIVSTLRMLGIRRHTHAARNLIAWLALVAVAWPSLGPLPYVVHDFDAHFHVDAHHHARDGVHANLDASSIPGSPLHPDDHNCPECQALKHLSRCMPAAIAVAIVAPVVVAVESPPAVVSSHHAQPPAYLPPVRAPPKALA